MAGYNMGLLIMDPYTYLYRLSILSGRVQQTFSRAYDLL